MPRWTATSWRRLWRFIASHEQTLWACMASMACVGPLVPPYVIDRPGGPGHPGAAPGPGPDSWREGGQGSLPPPAHPERLIPGAELSDTELMLWAQLTDEIGR
jgi:hypothetical protein